MSAPDGSDYIHDRVPWTWRKAASAVVAFAIGLILAIAAVKADQPDPAPVCYEQPRAELDGGEPVAVVCTNNNEEKQ